MIQRIINIFPSRNFTYADNTVAGVRGEHCATRLVIRFDEFDDESQMLNTEYKYRLILNDFFADIQYTNTTEENLAFDLPSAATDCDILRIQLLIANSDNSLIFKSNVVEFTFTESLDTSENSGIVKKYTGLMEENIEKHSAEVDKALAVIKAAIDYLNHEALTITGTGYNPTKGWLQFRTKDGTNAAQDIRGDIVDWALNEEKKVTGIGKSVYLSDLEWESAVSGWNTVKKNLNVNGGRLAFKDCNGKTIYYEKGLGTHANTSSGTNSVIIYRFAQGEYDVFEALTGVDANTTVNTPEISFAVGYLDSNGQEASEYLYDRGSNHGEFLNKNSPARLVRVDIPANATGIVLKCWAKADTINGGGHWANWGSARFIKYAESANPTIQEQIKNLMTGKADAAKLASQLADNSVTGTKIAAGTVTDTNIAMNAVGEGNLKNNAVTSTKITDGSVSASKLASNAVTGAKIASNAVSSSKIASSAVTTPKIADSSVTSQKLADNSVSYAKTDFLKEITNLADLTFTANGNLYVSEPFLLPASVVSGDSFIYSNVQAIYFGDENGQELGRYTVSSNTHGTLVIPNNTTDDVLSSWKTMWIQVTADNYNARNFRLLLPEKFHAVITEDNKLRKFISSIESDIADNSVTEAKIANGAVTAEKLSSELYNQITEKVLDSIVTETSIESPLDLNIGAAENHHIENGELVSDNFVDTSAEINIPFDCTLFPDSGTFPTVFTLYKFKDGAFEEMMTAGGLSSIELKGGFTYRFIAYHGSLPTVFFNPTSKVIIQSERFKNALKNLIREVIAENQSKGSD